MSRTKRVMKNVGYVFLGGMKNGEEEVEEDEVLIEKDEDRK